MSRGLGPYVVTQADLDRVRAAYAAWNRDDFDSWSELVHPEFVFQLSGAFPDLQPAYQGLPGAAKFWGDVREPWDQYLVHIDRLLECGDDRILVLLHVHALGRDGIEVRAAFGHLLVVDEGKAKQLVAYASWDEALRETGMESG